jgi:hypothetical protein
VRGSNNVFLNAVPITIGTIVIGTIAIGNTDFYSIDAPNILQTMPPTPPVETWRAASLRQGCPIYTRKAAIPGSLAVFFFHTDDTAPIAIWGTESHRYFFEHRFNEFSFVHMTFDKEI